MRGNLSVKSKKAPVPEEEKPMYVHALVHMHARICMHKHTYTLAGVTLGHT